MSDSAVRSDGPASFTGATAVVGAVTLCSLILGYGREVLIGTQFGATRVTDAFFLAFFTPQMIYMVVLAGPVLWATAPMLSKIAVRQGETAATHRGGELAMATLAVTTVVALVVLIAAHPIVQGIAPHLSGEDQALTRDLFRIMILQIIPYGVGAVMAALLYSRGRVLLPVVAQLVNNAAVVVLIISLHNTLGIHGVALAVNAASVLYCGFLVVAVRSTGPPLRLRVRSLRPTRGVAPASLLGLVAVAVWSQVPGLWERALATSLPPGYLSAIAYGYRVVQIGLGLLFAATSVAFAAMARSHARQDVELLRAQSDSSVKLNVIIGFVMAGGVLTVAPFVVRLAYDPAGNANAVLITNITMLACSGLPLLALTAALTQPLLVAARTRLFALCASVGVLVHLASSTVMIPMFGYKGFIAANLAAQVAAAGTYLAVAHAEGRIRWAQLLGASAMALLSVGVGVLVVRSAFVRDVALDRDAAAVQLVLQGGAYAVVASGIALGLVGARVAVRRMAATS